MVALMGNPVTTGWRLMILNSYVVYTPIPNV